MRTSQLQDYALPLALVFAIAFALTLNHENSTPSAGKPGIATAVEPDYAMTVVAKRLPPECRGAAATTPSCTARTNTAVVVREGNPREAARATMFNYAF